MSDYGNTHHWLEVEFTMRPVGAARVQQKALTEAWVLKCPLGKPSVMVGGWLQPL